MLAILKLLAWSARHVAAPRKDASDLVLILKNYLTPESTDRLYAQATQLGRYEGALQAIDRMTASQHARRLLAATYALLGRLDEARAEAQEYLKVVPGFSVTEWAKTEFYVDPGELERFVTGQRLAGLPE